jgi:hypothetical protein
MSDASIPAVRRPAKCLAPRCGRFVRTGVAFCDRHDPERDESDVDASPSGRNPEAFERRLRKRSYRALYDDPVANVMHQAAAMVAEQGLLDELGALRIVLARLVMEEQDLSRLAANVTKVAHVAVQAARAQRVISGATAEGLTNALTQVLIEVNPNGE